MKISQDLVIKATLSSTLATNFSTITRIMWIRIHVKLTTKTNTTVIIIIIIETQIFNPKGLINIHILYTYIHTYMIFIN